MTEQPKKGQRAARVALAVLAGALGTALVGAGLWMAFRPERRPTPTQIDREERVERTEAPTMPVVATTTTAEPTQTSAPSTSTTASTPPADDAAASAAVRADKLAFRLSGALYVANESGSGRTKVAVAAEGPYALSPDGTTLVWITGGKLKTRKLSSSKTVTIGPADAAFAPRWSGDSSTLYFRVRDGDVTTLMKLPKGGKTALNLATGIDAACSTDGRVVVVRDGNDALADGAGRVFVSLDGGAFSTVRVQGGEVTAVGATSSRVFVGLASSDQGASVVSLKTDGADRREITGAVPGNQPAVWGAIYPSPSGATLALEAQGDDGYSRVYTVAAGGGQLAPLASRLDVSFHGWSATGSQVFLIEGNAIQGESTSLVSVKPDGSAHRTVVAGAQ